MQLKVQEAMRKKEKFQREHEEVSHDWNFFSNHQKIIDIATKTNPFKCDTERKFSLTFSIKISPEIFFFRLVSEKEEVIRNVKGENPLSITMEKKSH